MKNWLKTSSSICFFTGLMILTGCSSSQITHSPGNTQDTGKQLVTLSRQLIGAPYRYGGESPRGFDCSGLVRYVYRQVGITVPHSSRLLYQKSRKVHLGNLHSGDLLFFNISESKISHVGIYAENGRFIHAPSSGKKVSIASLGNPYWKNKLIAAGRFH